MKYFPAPTTLILLSNFSPDECERRLCQSIDLEEPTMFGFSGYRGSKAFLGKVHGKHIRLLRRTYSSRNTLPTVFTGELQAQGTGTQLKGAFDLETTSKVAICMFDIVGLLILTPIIFFSHGSHPVLSAIFTCGCGGLLLFSPRIFRDMGQDQERNIADFLKETLLANDDLPSSAHGSNS